MIVALYGESYLVSENNAVVVSLSSLKVKFYGCDVNALQCEAFNGSESTLFKCSSLRARFPRHPWPLPSRMSRWMRDLKPFNAVS